MKSVHSNTTIAPLTDSELQDLRTYLEGIQNILLNNRGLTNAERRRMMRLSRENLLFVEDAVDAIEQLPELCPGLIKPENVKNSFALFGQLRFFEQIMTQITDALKDRRLDTGNKCFQDGLMIYQVTKMAAKGGYPKAKPIFQQMRKRFKMGNLKYQPEADMDLSPQDGLPMVGGDEQDALPNADAA